MDYRTGGEKPMKLTLAASAVSLSLTGAVAVADSEAEKQARWEAMHEEVTSAEAILSADVSNAGTVIGRVSSLVLSADGSRIQYVLYDIPYPNRSYPNEAGFSTFGAVRFDVEPGEYEVGVNFDAESLEQAPEELELTASEADHRLVSNVLGSQLYFSEDEALGIVDLLVDRESGEIRHYIVARDTESLFGLDRLAIPADRTEIGEGGTVRTSMDVDDIEDISQPYDTDFL